MFFNVFTPTPEELCRRHVPGASCWQDYGKNPDWRRQTEALSAEWPPAGLRSCQTISSMSSTLPGPRAPTLALRNTSIGRPVTDTDVPHSSDSWLGPTHHIPLGKVYFQTICPTNYFSAKGDVMRSFQHLWVQTQLYWTKCCKESSHLHAGAIFTAETTSQKNAFMSALSAATRQAAGLTSATLSGTPSPRTSL